MIITRARASLIAAAAAMATGSSLAVAPPSQADSPIVQLQSHESGKCLQPVNGSPGASIVQEPCNGSLSQQWTQGPSVDSGGTDANSLHFVNRSSQLCLDARGRATNGTPIQQWTCDWISNENWAFGVGNTQYNEELVSRVSGTWSHCISTPGVQDGAAMELYSCNGNVSEFWSLPTARLASPVTRVVNPRITTLAP
jgi:Ricin-type beta-trefoil lectin domain-like